MTKRKRYQTHFDQKDSASKSRTIQSQSADADINKILAKFRATGIINSLNEAELQFRDVSEFTDLKDALNQAKEAEAAFMRLPSKVREVFDHDPVVWLDTAHDADKRQALVDMGVIDAPTPPPAPEPVDPAPPPTEQPSS